MRSANFVEETTSSIAGVNGNGAISLVQLAGTPRFSTVFGNQATTIRYVIHDTVNIRYETGIGSVAANVLTRIRPQVTWDGSVYSDNVPSPIAFGSTPAIGNIRIRMSATAESQGPIMPGVNTTITTGDLFTIYRLNNSIRDNTNGLAGTLVANMEYYFCYRLDSSGLLDGFGLDVMTAAGTGIKTALYAMGNDGLPSSKIVDFNLINSTTTGFKADTSTATWTPSGPVWLVPGWYIIGLISDGACAIRGASHAFQQTSATPFGRANGYGNTSLISISGRNYTTGLPSFPSMSGAILRNENNSITGLWLGLRVRS